MPTVIFIPGYDSSLDDAVRMAWPLYGQLCSDAGPRSFRLLLWSWPAERTVRGLRSDMQSKACRTDTEGMLLGQLIDRVQPLVPLTLVGYSFGARIIGSALELLGGGQISGCGLSRQNAAPRVPLRAMLVAAGMDSDWFLPGHRDGEALSQVEQMFITINDDDRVLKWYAVCTKPGGRKPWATLGRHVRAASVRSKPSSISWMSLAPWAGTTTGIATSACSGVLQRLGSYTFRQPPAAPAAKVEAAKKEKTTAALSQPAQNRKAVVAN